MPLKPFSIVSQSVLSQNASIWQANKRETSDTDHWLRGWEQVVAGFSRAIDRFGSMCRPGGRGHTSSPTDRRNCSIISILRVKRASPQPLTWFRVSALRTYSLEQCAATRNVQKSGNMRQRAWPPLALEDTGQKVDFPAWQRKTKGAASTGREIPSPMDNSGYAPVLGDETRNSGGRDLKNSVCKESTCRDFSTRSLWRIIQANGFDSLMGLKWLRG